MTKLRSLHLLGVLVSVLISASAAYAQDVNLLSDTATLRTTILFSDVYAEKLVGGEPEAKPERISGFIIANFPIAAAGTIDATTPVGLVIGNFEHQATLGQASNYVAGGRTASFPFAEQIEQDDGSIKLRSVGSLTYSWSDTVLTIRLICTDIAAAELNDIAAGDYYDAAPSGTQVKITNQPVNVAVTFGLATGSRTALVNGVAKTVSEGGNELVSVDLQSVKLSHQALLQKQRQEVRALGLHQRAETRVLRAKQLQDRQTFTGSHRELLRKEALERRELALHQRQEKLELRARQRLELQAYRL
jgi:hypothetical protein